MKRLKLMGFISFIAGDLLPGRGKVRFLQSICQFIILALCSYIITLIFASWMDSRVNVKDIYKEASLVTSGKFEKSSDILNGKSFSLKPDKDKNSIWINVNFNDQEIDQNACTEKNSSNSSICIFKRRSAFGNASVLGGFKTLEFPSSSYSLPDMIIERAQSAGVKLSQSNIEKAKRQIEQEMGPIFKPSSSTVRVTRMFSGPIQYITIFLGVYGILYALLTSMGSLTNNLLVRSLKNISLTDIRWREHNSLREEDGSVGEDVVGQVPETYTMPWHKLPQLNNFNEVALFYDAIDNEIQSRASFLGSKVNPPILRMRTSAAKAVENTRNTSIVPTFLDAQKASISSAYDVKWTPVRYLIWVIPTIGFIGTILGVGNALGATLDLNSTRDLVSSAAQGQVSASMGMAFDTTFVALLVIVPLMALFNVLQGMEDQMILSERDSTESEVMRSVRIDPNSDSPQHVLENLMTMGLNMQLLTKNLNAFEQWGPQLTDAASRIVDAANELDSRADLDDQGSGAAYFVIVAITAIVLVVAGILISKALLS